ncbi:piggyBac transposable element-derived protein 4-like [Amyelois transitella]|uniref:piggyBac transposable element-derived protein 4-like n=1 Tax=Amyelois transitella TaxID=680683 RepID=UPI00298F6790|nr:piggyBac transposable element-derived protein 4-like [Amyelois transitella]
MAGVRRADKLRISLVCGFADWFGHLIGFAIYQEISDEEDLPNEDCSDVEDNVSEDYAQVEDCESESELEGDEEDNNTVHSEPTVASRSRSRSRTPQVDSDSSDDIPLAQLQSRSRPRKKNYFGKNRFRWASVPSIARSRTPQHNIVNQTPGLKPVFRAMLNNSTMPLDIWSLLFTDEMLEKIVLHTNEKIRRIRPKYKKQTCVQDLDLIELKAFIGLLFYTAIFKENHEHYTSWYSSDGTGREIFRCILSKNRLEVLLNTIRFDDAETREQRREQDLAAPVSELFQSLIQNFQDVYSIGTCACIDEMLVAFRGCCKFKMFMPKKPAKYGLKIMCITDARNGYLINAYIYLGKDSDGLTLTQEQKRLSKPTQAVLRLIPPIENSNRNVTADNWFSSIELVNVLKEKHLSFVGTLKKNKREIPPEFKPSRARATGSSIFGFTKDITLSSYVPKKNKAVVMVSSMHHTASVDESTKKPENILYYNQTKIGVDLLDQRCSNYSTARRTRRWPLAIFYRMLDISVSNAYVINCSNQAQKTESRFKFIKKLAEQLTKPHMERRVKNDHITRDVKNSIRRVLQISEDLPTSFTTEKLEVRKTCITCDPKKKAQDCFLMFHV